jgi:hypothetical protein
MQILLNIGVIGLVGLIAYWWSNQGAFSALLHFICVVVAGAVALAVWEPITTQWLLSGGFFDSYIWGISLIGVFAITLLILRVTMDKTIPANVELPAWMNYAFGLPVGAAAGVITVGIILIGCGFMQSTTEILGVKGAWRAGRTAEVGVEPDQRLWVPVHEITYELYAWLSVTSLNTSQPLRQYSPRLDWQAVSLVRDSWGDGKGRLSQQPDDARIQALYQCNDCTPARYAVKVLFNATARDYGEQLTLSRSQVRLIGDAKGTAEGRSAYPDSWTQYDGWHKFDDRSHFVSSQPGQESAAVTFEFVADDLRGQPPRFIQIRNIRYRLPTPQPASTGEFRQASGSAVASDGGLGLATGSGGGSLQAAIEVSNDIRPVTVSKNQMPGGIKEVDRWLTEGEGEFRRGGERPSRALMIQGIFEPAGTRIVKVNVSRNSAASIYGAAREGVPADAALALVDDKGQKYSPMGYVYQRPDQTTIIKLDPRNYLRTLEMIPELPTASEGHILHLCFTVTNGANLVEFRLGDKVIGTCNVAVAPRK